MPIPPHLEIVNLDTGMVVHDFRAPYTGSETLFIGRNELISWLGPFPKSDKVSRKHIVIEALDFQYGMGEDVSIKDAQSTNGTVPNPVPMASIPGYRRSDEGEKPSLEIRLADVISIGVRWCFPEEGMVDIGHFGTHEGAPGIDYLQSTLPDDIQSASTLIESLGASLDSGFIHLDEELVTSQERSSLISYTESHFDGSPDFKLYLSKSELIGLIGEGRVEELSQRMEDDFSDIVLRRVEDHGNAINFHTDYARRTMQIILSDESDYSGCDLVFATGQGFQQPRRKAGTATIHDYTVLHGVTEMKSGVRYSLFFLRNDSQFQRAAH